MEGFSVDALCVTVRQAVEGQFVLFWRFDGLYREATVGHRGAAAGQRPVAPWRLRALVRRARQRMADEPESGAWVTIWCVLMFFLVAMACTGLVVDGSARARGAQRAGWVASDAARAAADELWAAQATGGTPDPDQARAVAQEWVHAANGGTDDGLKVKDVQVDGSTVTVTVTGTYDTIFLELFHISHLRFTVTRSATAVQVIDGQAVP